MEILNEDMASHVILYSNTLHPKTLETLRIVVRRGLVQSWLAIHEEWVSWAERLLVQSLGALHLRLKVVPRG